ncbi:bifunctional MaoC family dehydratase N-terminal/OB-fold nucleic acid binding domain-containing protein [Streptomyces sp. NBRC 110611]|uniref:bifunctional MaoC family dehydratase N-terminal/OB-fold nucleic acid binding domain-containing protein n=1 Tax=Streptomyces sp. NBRC 110611 TaxID=1621259 RepID=UPI00082B00FD|nr:OB-fold domain-containing protein [Streptomyces sp. NBRC 110611]
MTKSDGLRAPGERHERDDLYGRLKAFEGVSAATTGVGKDPVNAPMIRHWCEAMGDANPAYDGPDAIAPPTMLQAWTMGGLSGHADRSPAYDGLFGLLDGAGYTSVVATDCEQEYLRPLRPGDRITFDAVIESVSERKATKLGAGYFVTTRMDIRANGEPAGKHRFRILKYAPVQRGSEVQEAGHPGAERSQPPLPSLPPPPPLPPLPPLPSSSPPPPQQFQQPPRPRRPRPVINRDNAGFWEGVSRHRLLIQRCGGCGTLRFPWLPGCHACGSQRWDTVESCGDGTVYSYVVMHHPPFPAFAPPYAVGLIELAEGVRMVSDVVGVPYGEVRIGMPVRLEFRQVDEELELPVFRGVGGEGERCGEGEGRGEGERCGEEA